MSCGLRTLRSPIPSPVIPPGWALPPQPKSLAPHLVIPGTRLGIAWEALGANVRGHPASELTPETTNKRYVAFPFIFFPCSPHLALLQLIKPIHPVAPGRARPIASAESARGAQGTSRSKRAWEHVVPEAACPLHPGRAWHPLLWVPRANGETKTRAFQPSSCGETGRTWS